MKYQGIIGEKKKILFSTTKAAKNFHLDSFYEQKTVW